MPRRNTATMIEIIRANSLCARVANAGRIGSLHEMLRPQTTAEPAAQFAIELYSINRQPAGWM
jgi:hypothetical protein